jgi:hypothetical protein
MDAPCHADTLTVCGYLINSYQNMQRFTELIFIFIITRVSDTPLTVPPNENFCFFIF